MGKRIHFVGCEGVSMKILARLMERDGFEVSGSDLSLGGHDAKNVDGADIVVYTSAIPCDNVELVRAKELSLPVFVRGEMLGAICSEYDFSIAVSGAHGKTTTTAMLWEALLPLDPTVHIGGGYGGEGGRMGGKDIFVTEACEYRRSFLFLKPDIAVILNVDLDHTDCYKDLSEMQESFALFGASAKRAVIVNGDEFPRVGGVRQRIITVGFGDFCDFSASCLSADKYGKYSFCVRRFGKRLGRVSLAVAGRHNVYNALFAIAAGLETGLSFGVLAAGLTRFKGAERRMELLGHIKGSAVFSDYAHHPKEITMSLLSVKESKYKHITAVFEPHTYTRTKSFAKEFAEGLCLADEIVLLPVYAAREKPIEGGTSQAIADALKEKGRESLLFGGYEKAAEYLRANLKDDGVILFMGAGMIDKMAREFVKKSI